jgi:hypothetical protein
MKSSVVKRLAAARLLAVALKRRTAMTRARVPGALASPVSSEGETPVAAAFPLVQTASAAFGPARPARHSAPLRQALFRRERLPTAARDGGRDGGDGVPAIPFPRLPSVELRRRPGSLARRAHLHSRTERRSRRPRFVSRRWCASASGPRDTQEGTTTHRPYRHRTPNSACRRSWSGHRPPASAAVPCLPALAPALPLPALAPVDWEPGRGPRRPPECRRRG